MNCVTNPVLDFFYIFRMLKDKTIQSIINGIYRDNKVTRIYKDNSNSVINHIYKLTYNMTHIIDDIYLGNACDASCFYKLKEYNITNIINSTKEIPNYFESDFEYFKIDIYDVNSNSYNNDIFNNTLDYIYRLQTEKNKKILIHCYMGSSRSATLVILYLMDRYEYTLEQALELVKSKRDIVNVNTEFIQNLRNFKREKVKTD